MNICFLIWNPDISGGTNVIFEHATRLCNAGEKVTIITSEKVCLSRLTWFPGAEKLNWKVFEEIENNSFDICIATWWRTVYSLKYIHADQYVYFVQSIESKFYSEHDLILQNLVELTYSLDLKIITEATWIKEYLANNYGKNAYLVKNGIRKEFFNDNIEPIAERSANKIRLLVEGPLGVSFKNTELALELANSSKADEVWMLTSTEIVAYPNVDRLFSRVPISEVGKIYSSCDVIIKLSTVEGMFGPPLEMFHCGGTSISYDVTGYDEYIINNENALVSFNRDNLDIVNKINKLVENRNLLIQLKKNAKLTAENWPNWDQSSNIMLNVLIDISKSRINQDIKKIGHIANLSWIMYEQTLITKNNETAVTYIYFRDKIITIIRTKHPKLFSFLRKVKWTWCAYLAKT